MKALIKKDVLTLGRQFRYFLVLLLFFAAIPGDFASSFAMVYAITLPVSAIAYDERSKWDTLAAGMPYTPLAIVGGKYALGYLGMAAFGCISLLARMFAASLRSVQMEGTVPFISNALFSLVLLAVVLPFVYRYGVEKGRIALYFLFGVFLAAFMLIGGQGGIINSVLPLGQSFVLSLAANALSLYVSVKIYVRHRR